MSPTQEGGRELRCPSRMAAHRRRTGSRAWKPRATRTAAAPHRPGGPTCPPGVWAVVEAPAVRPPGCCLRMDTVGWAFPGSATKGGNRHYPPSHSEHHSLQKALGTAIGLLPNSCFPSPHAWSLWKMDRPPVFIRIKSGREAARGTTATRTHGSIGGGTVGSPSAAAP